MSRGRHDAVDLIVHVTFGESAAGSLRIALRTLDRREEVIHLVDDLSYGPIDPGDPPQRMQWAIAELGFEDEPDVEDQIADFWQRVTTTNAQLVIWLSSRCASESCGLHELLWRVKQTAISVVDVADRSPSFGSVADGEIVAQQLYARATRISDLERKRYALAWQRLRQENAALRVLTESGLGSASITFFDDLLLAHATDDWRSVASVVRDTSVQLSQPYRQCSEEVLFARLLALVEAGVLEGEPNGDAWSYASTVRRANGEP